MMPDSEPGRRAPAADGGNAPGHRIIVGVDGSEHARDAASWAGAEAVRRHASLTIAHGLGLTSTYVPRLPEAMAEERRQDAQAMLDEELTLLSSIYPGLGVGTASSDDPPAPFLKGLSGEAELLVIGTRGHGGFAGMLVGSVSRKLAAHAHCPLIVVRTRPSLEVRNEVVLGVGPKPSPASVRFAFETAAAHDATLTVVRSWWPGAMRGGFEAPGGGMSVDQYDLFPASALAEVEDTLGLFRMQYPRVQVHIVIPEGNTVPALVETSRDTRLLVVGAHRRRGPFSVGAGYVVDGVIAHCATPVAVVPAV